MDAPAKPTTYPPRDADGRITALGDMLGGLGIAMLICGVVLVAIDGLVSVLITGKFGHISGWLGGILAVWMFIEDFRAWRGTVGRALAAVAGAVVGLGVGAPVAAALPFPVLWSGLIGMAIAGALYSVIWFEGVRFVASRLGER